MKQLKNVHKPLFSPWDTLDSPFYWGFSSSALDCQTFLTLSLWNGNTKLSTLKKKTHLKHLNNSLLTKPDDKGNSLLYEGNLSPAYDQNIHLRDKFLTDCHGPKIVSRIRRHLGMMQSRSPTSSPGSSRFPIWRQQERRPWHTAEITWLICPRRVEIYSKWRPR